MHGSQRVSNPITCPTHALNPNSTLEIQVQMLLLGPAEAQRPCSFQVPSERQAPEKCHSERASHHPLSDSHQERSLGVLGAVLVQSEEESLVRFNLKICPAGAQSTASRIASGIPRSHKPLPRNDNVSAVSLPFHQHQSQHTNAIWKYGLSSSQR